MDKPIKPSLPVKLAQGRQRLECWRREHKRYSRLPQELWSMAAELATEFGINRVASLLRLNYYDLKKRVKPSNQGDSPETAPNSLFLELPPTEPTIRTECTIECRDDLGTQLRIQLKGCMPPDLTELCAELWSK